MKITTLLISLFIFSLIWSQVDRFSIHNQADVRELISKRTRNSRTFVDSKNTFYLQQTAGSFHYKKNGNWEPIQTAATIQDSKFGIHQTDLPIQVDLKTGESKMALTNSVSFSIGNQTKLNFLDINLKTIKVEKAKFSTFKTSENELIQAEVFPKMERAQRLNYWSLETNYNITEKITFPTGSMYIEISDEVALPSYWKIKKEEGVETAFGWSGSLLIVDDKNIVRGKISKPVMYDSFTNFENDKSTGHARFGAFSLEKTKTGYRIGVRFETDYFKNENLVYPIILDPTVTNTYAGSIGVQDKNTQFNANCEITMDVQLPVGSTWAVTGTDTDYTIMSKGYISSGGSTDYYATRSEQRSKVGATTWTSVKSGVGGIVNNPSPYSYHLTNESIANGCYPSNALITYTWQAYQIYFPESGTAASNISGCVINYQELVANTWIVTTTYVASSNTFTATPTSQTICTGETTSIQFTSSAPNTTYAWTVAEVGVTGATAASGATIAQVLSASSTQTGTATYTITPTSGGCVGIPQDVTITVNPAPTVNAGTDQTICESTSIILSGTGAVSYTWDNGVTNGVSFSPTATTTYTVTGTDALGCKGTDDISITITPTPVVAIAVDVTFGCLPLTVNFTETNNVQGNTCFWDFGDGSTSTTCSAVSHTYTTEGCFDVTLISTTPNGCAGTLTQQDIVCTAPNPIAEFAMNPGTMDILQTTSTAQNNSIDGITYFWDFDDGYTSTEFEPTHTFNSDQGGNYNVMLVAYSNLGCRDTAYQVVVINDLIIYYVPNTFTPDGDENNPVFKPVFTSGFDANDYHLSIYNRWGQLIFESNDENYGWAGTNGLGSGLVPSGTYTWKIDFKTQPTDKRMIATGFVNIIR